MKKSVRRTITRIVVASVCATGLAAAAPAVADVVDPPDTQIQPWMTMPPDGNAVLVLTVRATGREVRHRILACRPTGGTHPSARRACDQLRAAGGDVRKIPAATGMCTTEYAPVAVSATGAWRAEERHYSRKFPNSCEAVRGTGGVLFNF